MVEWYWQGKDRSTGRKTYPGATLFNTNSTWSPRYRTRASSVRGRPITKAKHVLLVMTPCTLVINPRVSWVRPDKKLWEGHIVNNSVPSNDWIMCTEFCLSCWMQGMWISVRDCVRVKCHGFDVNVPMLVGG